MRRAILLNILAMMGLAALAPAQEEQPAQQAARIREHWSGYQYPSEFPAGARVYIIIKGDTLWDIAQRVYDNPLMWPQIHGANPYIANPDLIYPDDPLALPGLEIVEQGKVTDTPAAFKELQPRQEGGGAAQQVQRRAAGEEETTLAQLSFRTEPRPSREYAAVATDGDLYCSSVIYADHPDTDLWLVGSEEKEQLEISILDIVYISKGRDRVKPGELFIAANLMEKVRQPDTGKFLGFAYQERGVIRIILAGEEYSVGEVVYACDGLQVGAMLIPMELRTNPVVRVRREMPAIEQYSELPAGATGAIVYVNYESLEIMETEVINIDLGFADGLKAGDRCLVYRERRISGKHPYLRLLAGNNAKSLNISRVLGEVIVLRPSEHTSAVKVTFQVVPFKVGDKVRFLYE